MALSSPADRNGEEKAAGTQAITRALAVLGLFREAKSDLGVVQVATALDLRPSTAHRIVRALVHEGYLAQDERTERYYLGRTAVLLGLAAQRELGLQAAMPILERLGASTSESVNLGVRDDTCALVVLRVQSTMPLRFDQPPGTRVPLHASSVGKSLLAFGGDVDSYVKALGGRLPKFTATTITSARRLRQEIEQTRERGYSIDEQESIPGVRCIGAPVLDRSGRARAAVAIQAPSVRMTDQRVGELESDIRAAAKEIAELLPLGHDI